MGYDRLGTKGLSVTRTLSARWSPPLGKFFGGAHATGSAVLIEVLAAGLDWSCFKVACLKFWARADLGAVPNKAALF
jgi:hypothetical protein